MGTQRTLSELEALYSDNVAQEISPSDGRDLITTVRSRYLYLALPDLESGQDAGITAQDTWTQMSIPELVAYTSSADLNLVGTSVVYTGLVPAVLMSTLSLTLSTVAAPIQTFRFAPGINGTEQEIVTATRYIKAQLDPRTSPIVFAGVVQPGDAVDIFIKNETSTADASIVEFSAIHQVLPYEA